MLLLQGWSCKEKRRHKGRTGGQVKREPTARHHSCASAVPGSASAAALSLHNKARMRRVLTDSEVHSICKAKTRACCWCWRWAGGRFGPAWPAARPRPLSDQQQQPPLPPLPAGRRQSTLQGGEGAAARHMAKENGVDEELMCHSAIDPPACIAAEAGCRRRHT